MNRSATLGEKFMTHKTAASTTMDNYEKMLVETHLEIPTHLKRCLAYTICNSATK
jgi:hypothetical protein